VLDNNSLVLDNFLAVEIKIIEFLRIYTSVICPLDSSFTIDSYKVILLSRNVSSKKSQVYYSESLLKLHLFFRPLLLQISFKTNLRL
jgi:hypothetical protein